MHDLAPVYTIRNLVLTDERNKDCNTSIRGVRNSFCLAVRRRTEHFEEKNVLQDWHAVATLAHEDSACSGIIISADPPPTSNQINKTVLKMSIATMTVGV